ncbi:MarR family winged helix-turn-helix transcriptional regulator [Enterococcus sp. LJL128]|uniref:MarR family winged helix-turn-helix transcriptional regulator n=1 Tax=Enterococcus sp. LJL51 TaxID=3416656 RepID=UPI003CF27C02
MMENAAYSEIFFLLKQADLHITHLFESQMNISLTRYELLLQLAKKEAVSQRILQEKLGIDQAAVARHLKILEEKNYISRERNPENNREVLVYLTSEGKSVLHGCAGNKSELIDSLFRDYSPEQMCSFIQFLTDFNRQAEAVEEMISKKKG